MKIIMLFSPAFAIAAFLFDLPPVDKATMERGKKIYTLYCVTCHQADGGGVPGLNPPLEKTTYVAGNKTRLIKIILKGMNTHEEIDGETYTNVMPPFNYLKNQEISDVLTFIRNSFGNKSSVITPGDVRYVRSLKK
ncbi:MAG TPA: c-type cytochrome [Chitinophagaceae bacterium]|nr:c-type cytochrome [Chitinophagaceae bacterium]